MSIGNGNNPIDRFFPASVEGGAKNIGTKPKKKHAGSRRIYVTLSEENYQFLEAKAKRTGATISAVGAVSIDNDIQLQKSMFENSEREALKNELHEMRNKILHIHDNEENRSDRASGGRTR
jgi:ribosomal protein S19E (S16A)